MFYQTHDRKPRGLFTVDRKKANNSQLSEVESEECLVLVAC